MIRVMVVDDEALVRSGFRLILSAADDIHVVATTTGAEAVDAGRHSRPAVGPAAARPSISRPTSSGCSTP